MAEVGIHRFAASDDQHQSAQDKEQVEQTHMPEKRKAINGIDAARMSGRRPICHAPRAAMTANQTTRIGPKTMPTPDMPCY